MNIYIKLDDLSQKELLSLLPPTHPIAVQIKVERLNAETKAFRLSHEQIQKDVTVYVTNGGSIKLLPPDPRPGSLRKHKAAGKIKLPEKPKLNSMLKILDKDLLLSMLKAELQRKQSSG